MASVALARVASSAIIPPVSANQRVRSVRSVRVAASDSKGFGSEDAQPKQRPAVNKRGKVASRPGQVSKKELEKQGTQSSVEADVAEGIREEDEMTELPQVVGNRMLARMAIFAGVPFFGSLLLFPFFYYLKVVQDIDLPMFVVYIASFMALGGSLLGISYGVLSASWDPRREGSFLGFDEFRANLPALMDRMRRR